MSIFIIVKKVYARKQLEAYMELVKQEEEAKAKMDELRKQQEEIRLKMQKEYEEKLKSL